MNNKFFLVVTGVLLAIVLAACQGEISSSVEEMLCVPQTLEVTRIVPQTIEVTRIVQLPAIPPESEAAPTAAETSESSPPITVPVGSSSVQIDPEYFDGFIVLTQYYTLLDHGFFEEAVSLYSESKKKINGEKEDIAYLESTLKAVKVKFIHPFDYQHAQQGLPLQPIPDNEIRYVVGTTQYLQGQEWNISGTPIGTRVPETVTSFISLVLENGEWKINEINSSPWFP